MYATSKESVVKEKSSRGRSRVYRDVVDENALGSCLQSFGKRESDYLEKKNLTVKDNETGWRFGFPL